MKNINETKITKFIRDVCTDKTEAEIKQAEANFIRFIRLAEKVNERIQLEKQQIEKAEKLV